MKLKLMILITTILCLTGCSSVTEYIRDIQYRHSDEFYANLNNNDIKESCSYENAKKTSCMKNLIDKRYDARKKLNLAELYKDNNDVTKVERSNEIDYIKQPVAKKVINKQNITSTVNNTKVNTADKTSSAPKDSNSSNLKLNDFKQDYIVVDGMYYSTTKRDLDRSSFVLRCTDATMVDVMNMWKKQAIKDGQQKEYSELKDRIYTGLWNAQLDNIEANMMDSRMRVICEMMIKAQR